MKSKKRKGAKNTSLTSASRQALSPITPPSVPTELTTAERKRLEECEQTFARHETAISEVGRALAIIRDEHLYRVHGTFEDYCREHWGYSRAWAYRQINNTRANDNLLTVVNTENLPAPTHERQLRPIIHLEPNDQRAVWKKAVEIAGQQEVTSTHVGKAVKEIAGGSVAGFQSTESDCNCNWHEVERYLFKKLKSWPRERRWSFQDSLQKFIDINLSPIFVNGSML